MLRTQLAYVSDVKLMGLFKFRVPPLNQFKPYRSLNARGYGTAQNYLQQKKGVRLLLKTKQSKLVRGNLMEHFRDAIQVTIKILNLVIISKLKIN